MECRESKVLILNPLSGLFPTLVAILVPILVLVLQGLFLYNCPCFGFIFPRVFILGYVRILGYWSRGTRAQERGSVMGPRSVVGRARGV